MARLFALVGVAVALCVPAAAQAATTVQRVPFVGEVSLCTSGDVVELSGTLLITSTVTQTSSGGFMAAVHFQPQGISGVDTTTGTVYRATGLTRDIFVISPKGGYTETFINQFHIQATTGAESFLASEVFHITIGANGSVRVFLDRVSSTC
jgi:hypothetical protein